MMSDRLSAEDRMKAAGSKLRKPGFFAKAGDYISSLWDDLTDVPPRQPRDGRAKLDWDYGEDLSTEDRIMAAGSGLKGDRREPDPEDPLTYSGYGMDALKDDGLNPESDELNPEADMLEQSMTPMETLEPLPNVSFMYDEELIEAAQMLESRAQGLTQEDPMYSDVMAQLSEVDRELQKRIKDQEDTPEEEYTGNPLLN